MTVGTRSILFGVHQFLIHPVVLAIAWIKLYGFPWDIRLWIAFFVHDIGYIGKPNMDGKEGETHVELGAGIMHFLFDWPRLKWEKRQRLMIGIDARFVEFVDCLVANNYWRNFCLYHSRFYAKRDGAHISPLCIADKMAIVLMPTWLWVFLAKLTGEFDEYLIKAQERREQESKYVSMNIYDPDHTQFYENVKTYLRAWIKEHKDGKFDTWTPK